MRTPRGVLSSTTQRAPRSCVSVITQSENAQTLQVKGLCQLSARSRSLD